MELVQLTCIPMHVGNRPRGPLTIGLFILLTYGVLDVALWKISNEKSYNWSPGSKEVERYMRSMVWSVLTDPSFMKGIVDLQNRHVIAWREEADRIVALIKAEGFGIDPAMGGDMVTTDQFALALDDQKRGGYFCAQERLLALGEGLVGDGEPLSLDDTLQDRFRWKSRVGDPLHSRSAPQWPQSAAWADPFVMQWGTTCAADIVRAGLKCHERFRHNEGRLMRLTPRARRSLIENFLRFKNAKVKREGLIRVLTVEGAERFLCDPKWIDPPYTVWADGRVDGAAVDRLMATNGICVHELHKSVQHGEVGMGGWLCM